MLRKFGLFDKEITLPNGALYRYDRYKIPCCVDCNSLLGDNIERTISTVVEGGYESVVEFVRHGGGLWLATWLGLIFFKMHLRDNAFRHSLDAREGVEKIGDAYEWGLLHHVHTVIRHFYTKCEVSPEAIGSLIVLPLHGGGLPPAFDYADNFPTQAQLIGMGDFGVVSVLDDSSAAASCYYDILKKIDGSLSPLQLREVFVEVAWLRIHLKDRTRFHTLWDRGTKCEIIAERGSLVLLPLDFFIRGKMFHHYVGGNGVKILNSGFASSEEADRLMLEGRTSVLFDAEGYFIKDSKISFPDDESPIAGR